MARQGPAVDPAGGQAVSNTYRQVDSFESSTPTAAAVGRQRVAFGIDNSIVTVAGSQRESIDHGQRIVDVAVAGRVLVLSPGTLTAYTPEGDQIWSQRIEAGDTIAANTELGCCGVLGTKQLRLVDIDTGHNLSTVDRTRPGSSDDVFLATEMGFVYGTWSFLTGVDSDGELLFDRDLSAVVKSVGYCHGAVVTALQSGRLVGLAIASGDTAWQLELEPTHVGPIGGESVFVSSKTGIHTVSADGVSEPVPELSAGNVYATAGGEVVCTVRDGLISTHVHNRDRIEVDVKTSTVGVGGTVDIEVTNRSDESQTADLSVGLDNCSFSPSERTVSLGDGESTFVDFPIASVRAEGEATLAVAVDGEVLHETQLTVEDAADGTLAVETDLQPSVIANGACELTVTVTNTGGVTLDGVQLLESESPPETVEPGESWSETLSRPYDPNRRVSVGLAVTRGDRRREYAPTCRLPPAPTIEADVSRDALRATVSVDDGVTVSDRLVIEMPGAGRVREPVTIDGDELLLVVPQYDSGVARVSLDAIDVEERVELSASTSFTTPSSDSTVGPSSRPPTASHSPHASSGQPNHRSSADETSSTRTRSPRSPQSGPTSDASSSGAADADSGSTTGSGGGRSDPNDRSSGPSSTSTDRRDPQLTLSRTAPETVAAVGHAVGERLTISNDGERVAEPVAVIDDERIELGQMEPGETATIARFVTTVTDDQLVLPAAEIEVAGTVIDRAPKQQLPVDDDGIGVRAVADPSNGAVTAEIQNRSRRDCQVTELSVGSKHTESVSIPLPAGESSQLSTTVDAELLSLAAALLSVSVRYADGSEDSLDVLAANPSAVPETAVSGDASLSVSISDETQVAGEYGSAVLAFENDYDRPIQDVSVAAEGEPIDDMFYTEARRERLAPGERIEHFIDMESGIENPQFEATVSYTIDETTHEYTIRASGPAVDDEAAWTDSHLDAWSVERLDTTDDTDSETADDTDSEHSSIVSMAFRKLN